MYDVKLVGMCCIVMSQFIYKQLTIRLNDFNSSVPGIQDLTVLKSFNRRRNFLFDIPG
jgi:hypothetical protein